MSTTTALVTADEFSSMAHERPCELIRGEIVEMTSPGSRHGQVCSNVSHLLQTWSRQQLVPYNVISNDAGVLTERDSETDSVRGPDVSAIRNDRLPDGELPVGHMSVAPELCVEVLSPSDRWPDVLSKVSELLRAGVHEMWVINPAHRRVHLYHSDDEPTVLDHDENLTSTALPGLAFAVQELFFLT